ncbi:lamin-like protein [Malus sylvestris]|uniref:lamin-like protein n=1 Tax=Malus sylvestris TaxID=3752 RepID=UPI0021ACE5F9|nr:lamin-like protein [Malus sylvestris]
MSTKSSSSNSTDLILFLVFIISGLAVLTPIVATYHIVGAKHGWNPGHNYTLWVNNHTFYVGDLISFRYQKNQCNVFEVNQTGYDNCTLDSAVGNWSSGKDFIPLNQAKRYYFICGNGKCYNGTKVSVLVHLLPSPSKVAVSAHNSSLDAAVLVVPQQGFRALAVSLAMLCFGLGWA